MLNEYSRNFVDNTTENKNVRLRIIDIPLFLIEKHETKFIFPPNNHNTKDFQKLVEDLGNKITNETKKTKKTGTQSKRQFESFRIV